MVHSGNCEEDIKQERERGKESEPSIKIRIQKENVQHKAC